MRNFPRTVFSLNFLYIALIAAQVAAIIFLCIFIPYSLPLTVVCAGAWLFTAITSAVLFSRKGAAEVKCVWFVVIAAFPVAGALIYLLATMKKKPCGILKVNAPFTEFPLAAAANALCGTAAAGYDKAEYFDNGADFFKAMNEEISRAKKCVYMEFFIICRGQIFNQTLEAVKQAVNNGAEVKIILDGIGSAFKAGKRDLKRFKDIGAEIKIFHKLTPLPRAKLNFRDHRKIIAIDGKIAFTGGVNLADEYANIKSPYGYWKDTGVAVYGNAAKIFEGMFLSVWHGNYEMTVPAGGKKLCLPFYDSPPHRTFCEDAYISVISAAKSRVHIFTPYFCVSEKTAAALSFCARRGVDVKIIIPHIPDKKYAFAISKAYARALSSDGVKVYEFTPGFMHAKTLICDDSVFLGSYNLDFRSTHYNYECGVMFTGTMTDVVERDFSQCLTLSAPFDEGKLRPHKRFTRFVLKFFAPLI